MRVSFMRTAACESGRDISFFACRSPASEPHDRQLFIAPISCCLLPTLGQLGVRSVGFRGEHSRSSLFRIHREAVLSRLAIDHEEMAPALTANS
jgi:hypothetical protein